MKPTRSLLPLALTLSLVLTISRASAQEWHPDFNQPISATEWNLLGAPKTVDGELDLSTDPAADAGAFVDSGLVSKAGFAGLNFIKASSSVELGGLAFGGSAPEQNRLFMLIIGADAARENKAKSYVKLRLSADGSAIVVAGAAGQPEKPVITTTVALPSKQLTLKLDVDGAHLTSVGADGREVTESGSWDGLLDISLWQNAKPYLLLKAVRRPGEGDTRVTIKQAAILPAR